jgi:hypothetical protein
MNASQWLIIASLGLLMGAAGQILRAFVGIKKARDEGAYSGKGLAAVFEASTLMVSLLIGAAAGAIAAISTIRSFDNISSQTLLALGAAGYTGSDFLEGIMAKFVPGSDSAPTNKSTEVNDTPNPGPTLAPQTQLAQSPAPVTALP